MTASLRIPRILSDAVHTGLTHEVEGPDVGAALDALFRSQPGLRNHVVDEQGAIRPHVAVFVDGVRAALDTPVGEGGEIWIIQAVSGGAGPSNA